jgi:surfeit locus 1 family protein
MPLRLFSRQWLLTTLLVLVGVGVLARLGIWQLDRLAQRRVFNARVQAQLDQPRLVLSGEALQADLYNMEYRAVVVRGEYDFAHQVALRNQVDQDRPGVSLLTPLKIEGSDRAVIVNRGWIPLEDADPTRWDRYDQPGMIEIQGVIRRPQTRPDFGRINDNIPTAGEPPLLTWNLANVPGMAGQTPYPLLSVYVQQIPASSHAVEESSAPIPSAPKLELTEGPHLGYAIQWFTFAAILGAGYPFFVRREDDRKAQHLRSAS